MSSHLSVILSTPVQLIDMLVRLSSTGVVLLLNSSVCLDLSWEKELRLSGYIGTITRNYNRVMRRHRCTSLTLVVDRLKLRHVVVPLLLLATLINRVVVLAYFPFCLLVAFD